MGGGKDKGYRVLGKYEASGLFMREKKHGRVRITREHPIVGVLGRDRIGIDFLTPEEEGRGSGMGLIRVLGFSSEHGVPPYGCVVKIAGTYEDGVGLTVEAIASEGEPFEGGD
jgi:hypothetical protein